jgi:hypothetical protein
MLVIIVAKPQKRTARERARNDVGKDAGTLQHNVDS